MVDESELGGYALIGRLAVGGMAEVYQARPKPGVPRVPGEPDDVVLKRLLPAFRADGAYVKQFVDEAKLTTRLRHPNIVRTFRCFKAGNDYLMVQELVTGRSLSYVQESFIAGNAPMPPQAATYIVYSVLRALDYLHRAKVGEGGASVVHRDVSPANVLLSVQGEVKLTDFGVAELEGQPSGERGALRGTLSYMSPEQVLGLQVDSRTDLFAAGILFWELLANRRLYAGQGDVELVHLVRDARVPPLAEVAPQTPAYAAQIARKALFADKNLRFGSAAEFSKALELLAKRHGWPLTPEALRPLLGGKASAQG